MLGLAVAVVVLAVGGADRDPHREQRQQGGDEVGRRVRRLGDEAERAADRGRVASLIATRNDRRDDAEQRGALALVGAGRREPRDVVVGCRRAIGDRGGHSREGRRRQRRLMPAEMAIASATPA